MRRAARILLNVATVLSSLLFLATLALWLDGPGRDHFVGRSSVGSGWAPETPASAIAAAAPPPDGFSTVRFHERVTLVAVVDGGLWISDHAATYESWLGHTDEPWGGASSGYVDAERVARARQGGRWHAAGYDRFACPAMGWGNASRGIQRAAPPVWSRWGASWHVSEGTQSTTPTWKSRFFDASFLPCAWRFRAACVSLGTLVVLFGVLPVTRLAGFALPAWIGRHGRQRRRRRAGLCMSCGYDLRATPDRCPECGREAVPR